MGRRIHLVAAIICLATGVLLAPAGLLATPSPVRTSAESAGSWKATSDTAVAITGDITVKDNQLIFGNGTVLPLTFVAEKESMWAPLRTSVGKIFRLDPPIDPVLLNGNALCGMPTPVTYIVLSQYSSNSLSLTVFTGSSPPARFGDNSCAAYFYERAAAAPHADRRPDWWTRVTSNPATAGIETTATDGKTILDGGCNTQLTPGFSASLYNYGGGALSRIDDVSEPVSFEIVDGQGRRTTFGAAMHYFAPDQAWVLTDMLPVVFLDALADGEALTIRNDRGETAVSFDLAGAGRTVGVMRAVCGLPAMR